jgi:prepilin-type N-terminal cleavage/methylation domain-containing protein
MKKGFSLAEVMIALIIVGVIIAVVLPVVNRTTADNDKILYKSAFKTVEQVVNELISDISLYPAGNFYNATSTDYFCTNFSNKLNTIGTVTCDGASTIPGTPNFIISNGMRWYGMRSGFAANATIHIDIDGAGKGTNADGSDILEIIITDQGKVTAPSGTETNYLMN